LDSRNRLESTLPADGIEAYDVAVQPRPTARLGTEQERMKPIERNSNKGRSGFGGN
jgi:hypothetical protein